LRIALVGYMGSGKSTVGKLLSERMSIPFIDLDEVIEKREGKTIAALFDEKGEAHFRQLESDTLREILTQNTPFILATGG
jgi:shikimate kinase